MKKLLQLLIVSVMAVSCLFFAVSCLDDSGNGSSNGSVTCEHDYKETVVAATCTTGGYTEHKCSKCGETYKDNEVSALGHDMTEWAEKTAATCVDAQVMERHCKRTGCTEAETKDGTPALGHEMEWTTTLEPTCTTDGKKDGECKREGCDHTESDVVIEKLNHHYVESTDDEKAKAATCTEDGLKVEICDREGCGDRKETTIPAFGHTPDETKAEVTAPTCTEQGYTTYHCETCGQDYKDDYVNARGHEMALTETVGVTCLTDGYELWECQRGNCDHSERREVVDKLDHVFDNDGNCESGCGKTINDKLTWVNTKYDVTYNESTDRLTLIGGDPCGEGSIAPDSQTNYKSITIPAAVLAAKKAAGLSTFTVTMYRLEGTTPQFRISYDESTFDESGNNVEYYTSKVITIDDEMLQNGFKFLASYTDLTQRNPAWGGTKVCDGFDFDIEFIKPFDINDKSTWLSSAINGGYNAEKGRWVYVGGDNGKSTFEGVITVRAELLKAMKEANYASFTVSMIMSKDGQRPQFGLWDDSKGNYTWNHAHTGPSKNTITITDEMVANGKDIKVAYLDNNQQNPAWGATEITDGFDFDIEFIKEFDINDKSMWIISSFASTTYSSEKGLWVITDADPGTASVKGTITIRAEVIKAMKDAGKTTFTVSMIMSKEGQTPQFGINGAYAHGHINPVTATMTITDEMLTVGVAITAEYVDNTQRNSAWGGTVITDGFDFDITFA